MSFKQAATDLVRAALDGQMDFFVLRGLDDLAREDGDIDVLVPSGRSGQALLRVAERAVDAGWTIAGVGDIGYLTQICLVQRLGAGQAHRAVKVDFFNGAAWAAIGADPMGQALFERLNETLSDTEVIGLATLLQKMLYAGYLSERDRDRITAACAPERISAFLDAIGLPLSRADLDRGRLSRRARWRLRAASAGVGVARMPGWGLRVIWRKLYFTLFRSTIPGRILQVAGADSPRRAAITGRFRSLLERAGFPNSLVMPETDADLVSLAWRKFRGETVVLYAESAGSTPTRAAWLEPVLQVKIQQRDADGGDDLERVLTVVSQHILETLRRTVTS
ncbi:hypothetical protein ACEWPM_017060 [Roseovarius sp. S4756]|uniref:hypothetical protein n=1 Tax=Roseovarius maritimus TaxID=3342637 RepID=UPI00372A2368